MQRCQLRFAATRDVLIMYKIMEFVSSTELIPRFVVTKVVQIKQKREVYVVLTVPRSITRNVNMKVVLVWSSTAAFVSGKQKLVINMEVCFARLTPYTPTSSCPLRHGAVKRKCSAEGCTNNAVKDGVCCRRKFYIICVESLHKMISFDSFLNPLNSFTIQMGRRREYPKHVAMRVVQRRLKQKDFATATGRRNTVVDILDVRAGLDKVDFVSLMVVGHHKRKSAATKDVLEG